MKCLNLGCGTRYDDRWTNVDFTSTGTGVIAHDLKQGIPFGDESFDLVYHSHVLEHFSKEESSRFLKECFRVLRSCGVLRVVVPDLFFLVKQYLEAYEKVNNGIAGWDSNYEWAMIHLLDQSVRDKSGGAMLKYISSDDLVNESYVIGSWGLEAKQIISKIRGMSQHANAFVSNRNFRYKIQQKVKTFRDIFLRCLLGRKDYYALLLGRFRNGGEIHKWMYDKYSLKLLLQSCGFVDVIEREADESYMSEFNKYCLDVETNGNIYRPDSLIMEAKKVII